MKNAKTDIGNIIGGGKIDFLLISKNVCFK